MTELRDVSKSYDGRHVIRQLSFRFPEKGLVLLMGPSGCGKTTLLRLLAGLEKPDSGTVLRKGSVSFCFQEYRLFPQLTAIDNVRLLAWRKPDAACTARASAMLTALGLTEAQQGLRPDALSGGMRQRVSLARALCGDASLILLDEPLKELDAVLRDKAGALIL